MQNGHTLTFQQTSGKHGNKPKKITKKERLKLVEKTKWGAGYQATAGSSVEKAQNNRF